LSEQEAIDFLSQAAFVAFPSVRDWLSATKTPNESIKMMAKGLSDIKRDEADAVIDSWITGRVEAPKYLRDGFVLHIRACALQIRAERVFAEKQAERHEQERRRAQASTYIGSQIRNKGAFVTDWPKIRSAYDRGELTREEALQTWYDLIGYKRGE